MKNNYWILIIAGLFYFGIIGAGSNSVDIQSFEKKIWIVDGWDGGNYDAPSIYITKISGDVFEGKLSTGAIAIPDSYAYLYLNEDYVADISGKIVNGVAECHFKDYAGNEGDIELCFQKEGVIEAAFVYFEKGISIYGEDFSQMDLDGNYLLHPYNLKDIRGRIKAEETKNKIELDVWGEVILVTEQQKNESLNTICTLVYLTDEQGNILYKFYTSYVGNTRVTDFSIEDINGDGLEDITIFSSNDESGISGKIKYFQMENGWFLYN